MQDTTQNRNPASPPIAEPTRAEAVAALEREGIPAAAIGVVMDLVAVLGAAGAVVEDGAVATAATERDA